MIRFSAALFLSLAAMAQPLHFEAASVKPSTPENGGVIGGCHGVDTAAAVLQQAGTPPLGRCVITGARLAHLVNIAWSINGMQLIESGPDRIQRGAERFNVVAKAEDTAHTTEQQLLTMLQNLLIERFQMKFHREPVKTDGVSLTVDKTGPKLTESTAENFSFSMGPGGKPVKGQPGFFQATRCSLPMLASFLSTFGGFGPVVDNTGLKGAYDFTLSWDEEAGPTLVKAVQQQLGLHVSQEKVMVSSFVIDSAQPPSAN